MSDEHITGPTTIYFTLNPQSSYFGTKTRVEFEGSCLKQHKTTYDHGKVVHIYIVDEISKNYGKQLSNTGKFFIWCSCIN